MAKGLRPYQHEAKQDIYNAWRAGHQNVLLVLPTGMGKTVSFCSIAIDLAVTPSTGKRPTAIMVHRKELVQQISLTLAEEGIVHNIIAPRPTIQGIIAAQRLMYGKQFYDYNSLVTVLSVDTLNARIDKHKKWTESIQFWITDEAAHLLKNNKWGKAVGHFQNAIGLGVTATPERLDKRGLGRHADGVFDVMVEGPSVRWGIENGFLSNYKIAVPQSDYRHFLQKAANGSDFSHDAMASAAAQSQIVGDVVKNYQKFANGKQAILFASDISSGNKMEAKFREAGISAKILTGDTDDRTRLNSLIEYREKRIKVLLNVDLFDEGLDVPGIECVIMARPTMSIGKYRQMIGRGLRPAKNKDFLIIIDHVGNVPEHGLPDSHYSWTLDRIVKRRDRTNLIRICSNWECNSPYDRLLTECPYCGTKVQPAASGGGGGRVTPMEVDGDLELLDPETLREMYDNSKLETPAKIMERVSQAAGVIAGKRAFKKQTERIETQRELTDVVAQWAGVIRARGYSDRHINKKFYLDFGMTITEALSQPREAMLDIIADLRGSYEIRSRDSGRNPTRSTETRGDFGAQQ